MLRSLRIHSLASKSAVDCDGRNVVTNQIVALKCSDPTCRRVPVAVSQALIDPLVAVVYQLYAVGSRYVPPADDQLQQIYGAADSSGTGCKPNFKVTVPLTYPRPLNSWLNTEKLRQSFCIHLAEWRGGVIPMLKEVLENDGY